MPRKPDGDSPKETVSIKVDGEVLAAAKEISYPPKYKSFSAYVESLLKADLKKHGKLPKGKE